MQANVVNSFQMDEGVLEKPLKRQFKENLAMLKELLEIKCAPLASEAASSDGMN